MICGNLRYPDDTTGPSYGEAGFTHGPVTHYSTGIGPRLEWRRGPPARWLTLYFASAKAPLTELPTAVQVVAEVHDTPVSLST